MFNSRKNKELLEQKCMTQQAKIDAMQKRINNLQDIISNYDNNLDYLVEKGVLSGPLNESIVKAIKLGINLRVNRFLASKEEIDDYFTK